MCKHTFHSQALPHLASRKACLMLLAVQGWASLNQGLGGHCMIRPSGSDISQMGFTPLHLAAAYGFPSIVVKLLRLMPEPQVDESHTFPYAEDVVACEYEVR